MKSGVLRTKSDELLMNSDEFYFGLFSVFAGGGGVVDGGGGGRIADGGGVAGVTVATAAAAAAALVAAGTGMEWEARRMEVGRAATLRG